MEKLTPHPTPFLGWTLTYEPGSKLTECLCNSVNLRRQNPLMTRLWLIIYTLKPAPELIFQTCSRPTLKWKMFEVIFVVRHIMCEWLLSLLAIILWCLLIIFCVRLASTVYEANHIWSTILLEPRRNWCLAKLNIRLKFNFTPKCRKAIGLTYRRIKHHSR